MDREQVWEQYKEEWSSGESPEMDLDTFCNLFCDFKVSIEAINLVNISKYARKTLEGAIKDISGSLCRVFDNSRLVDV